MTGPMCTCSRRRLDLGGQQTYGDEGLLPRSRFRAQGEPRPSGRDPWTSELGDAMCTGPSVRVARTPTPL